MIVKNIILNNFRNYENEEIEFDKKLNIIYGNNAQGKTNILESIYLFSLGKSNRALHDVNMIRFGEKKAEVDVSFFSRERESSGKIEIFLNKKKKISINEININKSSDLIGIFNVVYFGPEYLSLIKDGPKKRRKNIDILISQLRRGYLSALSEYKKLIEQKSNLLKNEKIDEVFLSILNEKLIELSCYIIENRFYYIKKIEKLSKEIQYEISDGKDSFGMDYISCGIKIDEKNINNLKNILSEKALKIFEKEKFYKECLFGPHRDDIEFKINNLNLKDFGSQGQQKTGVLVQKIAEVELFKEETGEYPVLLLDDIMSELDEKRQEFVLNKIRNMQIFITCTEKEIFKKVESGKIFKIEKGRVLECTCI